MTLPAPAPTVISGMATDALSAGLLVVFVGLLFLGYFDPRVPYSGVAVFPLVGSLALLFWTNRASDRVARSRPVGSDT